MEVAEIMQLAAAATGGGGISFIIGKLIDRGHEGKQSEIGRLRDDIKKCTDAHVACEKRVAELSERVRAVEASTPSYLARWVKDQDKRLIWLNDRAYMLMFAPLGWTRGEVLDKSFLELLGEGAGSAIKVIEELDAYALKHPGEVQSTIIQLHPDLPTMVVVKVAFVAEDGLLRYEGSSFVPNGLSDSMGQMRQRMQRESASRHLFQGDDE